MIKARMHQKAQLQCFQRGAFWEKRAKYFNEYFLSSASYRKVQTFHSVCLGSQHSLNPQGIQRVLL